MRYLNSPVLIIIFFSACNVNASVAPKNQTESAIPVKLAPIVSDTINNYIEAAGVLSTEEESRLSFKTGGIINRVLVQEGQFVKKGQLLASIKSGEVDAQVEEVQLAYQKAKRDYQRTVNLYLDKTATLEQMQNAKTGSDLAYQNVQQVKFNQQYSNIYAISDGFVVKKLSNDGEVTAPGMPVLILHSASAASKWIVKLSVADKVWTAIPKGNKAIIIVDAYPGKTFMGIVSKKSMAADAATGSFTIEVEVDFKDVKPAMGMFATAKIIPSEITMGHVIPFDALIDANDSNGFVFVSDDKKRVRKVAVTISSIGKDQVYLKDGLKDHLYVVVSGSPYLKDSSLIKQVQ